MSSNISSYVEDEETHAPHFNVSVVAELGQNLLEESQLNARRIRMLEESDAEKSQEIKQLKDAVSTLKSHRVRLEDQLSEATQANFSLLKELEYTKNQVRVVTSKDKSYSILAEHYRNTILELESVKAEVQKKDIMQVQMKKELNRIEREHREEREHRNNIASSAGSEDDSAIAPDINVSLAPSPRAITRRSLSTGNIAVAQLQAKLQEARAQLDAKIDAFNELENHSKQITEMNLTLIKRINELESEKEERIKMEQKKKEQEEMDQMNEVSNEEVVFFTRERSKSIASEIESQIKSTLEDQIRGSFESEIGLPKEPVADVNHNMEYFHMTLQAMKVQFSIKNKLPFSTERVSEKVFLVKSSSLYEQVNAEKVPFHEWHKWIKKRLESTINAMLTEEDDLKKIQQMNLTNSSNSKFTQLSKSVTFSEKEEHPEVLTKSLVNNVKNKKLGTTSSLDSIHFDLSASAPASPRCCKNFQPQFWKKSLCKECSRTQQEHLQQAFNARTTSSPNLKPILKQRSSFRN